MKKLMLLTALLTFLFFGCNTNDSVVEPDSLDNQNENLIKVGDKYVSWIKLPEISENALRKDVTTGKWVNGSTESLLEINENYAGGVHGWVSITANLRFQRGAFDGWKYITMSINDEFGTGSFSPAGSFYKPAIYNITIQGVDLSGVNPNNVNFVYLSPDGTYEEVVNDGMTVEPASGKLQIRNALLPHFSRYGFTN